MRHRKKVKKLGRTKAHRKALLRNLASQIILHHEIKTTLAKAKAARSFIERLITYAKNDTVHARRLAFKHLQNRTLVKKLFDEIGPAFEDRNGGYTRVIKLGQRRGDGAELAVLQLVGFESSLVSAPTKSKKKKAAPKSEEKAPEKEEAAAATEAVTEEAPAEEKPKAKKTKGRKKKTEEKAEAKEPKAPAEEKEAKTEAEEAPVAESDEEKEVGEASESADQPEQNAETKEEKNEPEEKKSSGKDDSK